MKIKSVSVVTLGCPKNIAISRDLKHSLISRGLTLCDKPSESDLILINTCGFIEAAKEESIETILELAGLAQSNGSKRIIYAFGCMAQLYGDELSKAIPEVDGFLSDSELIPFIDTIEMEECNRPIAAADLSDGKTWAYLRISEGCDRKCSFCVIPKIKGAYRSRSREDIIAEAHQLSDLGVKELVLVGQDTGIYGTDLYKNYDLSRLVADVAATDGINWVRLLYIQPDNLSQDLIDVINEHPKVCRYLDIPFQHSSLSILRSMNRRGSDNNFTELIESVRASIERVSIRTAAIVGYPGETRDDFNNLVEFIRKAEPDYLGLFKYSAEPGTKAASLAKQVGAKTAENRFAHLKEAADAVGIARKERLIGGEATMMIDRVIAAGIYEGRLEGQAPEIDGDTLLTSPMKLSIGSLVRVTITGAAGYDLEARLSVI